MNLREKHDNLISTKIKCIRFKGGAVYTGEWKG